MRHRFTVLCASLVTIMFTASCTPALLHTELPLATWDPSQTESFSDSTIGEGQLLMTETCVHFIRDDQKSFLLIWPEPTSWNSQKKEIDYVGPHGKQAELRDGDRIIPGGSITSPEFPYVSAPDPSCLEDAAFIVSSIRLQSNE